jgi:hypothetical protein
MGVIFLQISDFELPAFCREDGLAPMHDAYGARFISRASSGCQKVSSICTNSLRGQFCFQQFSFREEKSRTWSTDQDLIERSKNLIHSEFSGKQIQCACVFPGLFL